MAVAMGSVPSAAVQQDAVRHRDKRHSPWFSFCLGSPRPSAAAIRDAVAHKPCSTEQAEDAATALLRLCSDFLGEDEMASIVAEPAAAASNKQGELVRLLDSQTSRVSVV
jgi:hypothetical protein